MSDTEAVTKVREILREYSVHDDYHVFLNQSKLIQALRDIREVVFTHPKAVALTPEQIRELSEERPNE